MNATLERQNGTEIATQNTEHCVCCGAKIDNKDSTQLCWKCQIIIEEN